MIERRVLGLSAGFVLAIAVAAAPARGGDKAASAPPTDWKMSGQMEESCSCDSACPCWWGSHPTKMMCSGVEMIFIEHGNLGKVSLDGLAMGQIDQSPEGKTMAESMGDWNFGYLYLDEKANPEQRRALEQIAAQVFAPIPADRVKIRYVPITRKIEGAEHRVTIGSYGSFSAHLLAGGLGGTPKISNPPLPEPMHKEWSQGTTTRQAYDDAAKWDFSNSNYMYAAFNVTGEDYAKFFAAMAAESKDTKK